MAQRNQRDIETFEDEKGNWIATCKDFPGLYVEEETRKTAKRSMKNLLKDLERDMRQWGQTDPMINL